jgi:Tfp pilus assembly protein PilF
VRAIRFASLVLVCVLALGGVASLPLAETYAAVVAAPLAYPARETLNRVLATEGDAPATSPDQSADAPARKKHGNAFVRVLTAPFRAIGRFFAGKKSSRQAQSALVKVETKPALPADPAAAGATSPPAEPTRAQGDAASAAASATDATYAPAPSLLAPAKTIEPAVTTPAAQPQIVSMSQPSSEAAASTANAPSSVSPSTLPPNPSAIEVAPPSAAAAAAPFTPLIVGVAGDPLSQGRALLERGYKTEAIRELSVAAVTGANLVEANNLLGLAHDRLGKHAEARAYYERALSVAPADARVINNVGYSLYLEGRYKDALSKLKTAARLAPESPEIYTNLGFVYARLDKYDDALRNFARAGGDFYARVQTGALLEVGGRDLEAVKHYEAARRIDPARADVLRRLISLYTRTGQRAKAEAAERSLDRPKDKVIPSPSG